MGILGYTMGILGYTRVYIGILWYTMGTQWVYMGIQRVYMGYTKGIQGVIKFLVSKETVVLRRWERSKQKFGFIKRVDKGEITTVKDLES